MLREGRVKKLLKNKQKKKQKKRVEYKESFHF